MIDVSQTGKYLVTPKKFINDPCGGFLGEESPSTYALINPLTGVEKKFFGQNGKLINVIAFSPDDTKILYAAYDPKTNNNQCDTPSEKSYFLMNIGNSQVQSVVDYKDLLKKWNKLEVTNSETSGYSVWYGENKLVDVGNGQVIATYVQK